MSSNYLAKLNLGALRYCVLVVFLICNAVTASFSAWNLGIVQGIERSVASIQRIDAYLAFLGGSGLVILVIVAFVELASISWFIATVWFEYVWISIWGLMYLAAAIAVTIIASQEDCSTAGQALKCVSLQVLLAFTWLCAMALIAYFSVFMFALFINKRKYSTIWHSMMRRFPWAETCVILAGPPATSAAPTLPAFVRKSSVPIIHAPKPKHARPDVSSRLPAIPWRSGLGPEYQVEEYSPPMSPQTGSNWSAQSHSAELPPAARPPVISPALTAIADSETLESNFASMLYPMHVQQTINTPNMSGSRRSEPALYRVNSDGATRVSAGVTRPPSPPPLGHWPRPDILSQPVTKGKRKAPALAVIHGDDSENGVGVSSYALSGTEQREICRQPAPRVLSRRARPAGPRKSASDLPSGSPGPEDKSLEYA